MLPWLLVTTVNLARNHRRGSLRYRDLVASLPRQESPNAESIALANADTRILGVKLSEAFSQVSHSDVALLVLTALDGLSIVDAAGALGLKPGTARMRLSRARERLQTTLTDETYRFAQSTTEGTSA